MKKYFEDVIEKIYLHSDGAPIYKCYDVGELIQRIACLVHMRRPFFKLKDFSEDAMVMLKLFEAIFREDKKIKAAFSTPEEIQRERVLRIGPMLNDMKSYLDKLAKNLEKEEEPELLKAVNYALVEYPCMLRCLEDGTLACRITYVSDRLEELRSIAIIVILLAVLKQVCALLA